MGMKIKSKKTLSEIIFKWVDCGGENSLKVAAQLERSRTPPFSQRSPPPEPSSHIAQEKCTPPTENSSPHNINRRSCNPKSTGRGLACP